MLILDVRVSRGMAVVLGSLLAGCGLISSDVTNFDLSLPAKQFTINAGSWQVDSAGASDYLALDCTGVPTACDAAVQQACAMGCSGSCNTASHTCDLSLDISLTQMVNLVMERPELKTLNDEPVIDVTVDSVTYDITGNTLDVDTPEITVYVAPSSVTSVNGDDAAATVIGTIAPVPARQTTTTRQSIKFTATGKADLVRIMSTFKTPFNVLVGSSIVVTAGQPIPTGQLDAVVYIKGHAGL